MLNRCVRQCHIVGKGLEGKVEDDMLFNTKLSKTFCPLLQGNITTLHELTVFCHLDVFIMQSCELLSISFPLKIRGNVNLWVFRPKALNMWTLSILIHVMQEQTCLLIICNDNTV